MTNPEYGSHVKGPKGQNWCVKDPSNLCCTCISISAKQCHTQEGLEWFCIRVPTFILMWWMFSVCFFHFVSLFPHSFFLIWWMFSVCFFHFGTTMLCLLYLAPFCHHMFGYAWWKRKLETCSSRINISWKLCF